MCVCVGVWLSINRVCVTRLHGFDWTGWLCFALLQSVQSTLTPPPLLQASTIIFPFPPHHTSPLFLQLQSQALCGHLSPSFLPLTLGIRKRHGGSRVTVASLTDTRPPAYRLLLRLLLRRDSKAQQGTLSALLVLPSLSFRAVHSGIVASSSALFRAS